MATRVQTRPGRTQMRHGSSSYRNSRSSLYISSLEPITTPDEEDEDESIVCETSDSPSTSPSPTHGQDSSASTVDDASPPYKIASAPLTDGVGLFATRAISKGTVVLSEAPMFTQPPSPARTNSTVMAALSQCTRDEQRQYFNLANAYKAPAAKARALLPALGIFETNALPCSPTTKTRSVPRAGIFLTAARLNHSCRPNVARAWDEGAQQMAFRALRDVAEGEELCMNYIDVVGTREQRAAELERAYGFACACEACALGFEERAESDRRRAALRRLFEEVAACGNEPTLGLRKVKLALQLLKEEELVHYEASFCFDGFQFCILVSDYVNAKAWIRKAWEASCNTSGPDSPASRAFKMYWANPRAHELAGTLPRATLHGPD